MSRILYLYAQAYRAGSQHGRHSVQMLALMRAAGLEVDLLTLPGGDPWPEGVVRRIYYTARVPFARTLRPYGTGPRRWWATFVLTLTAARLFLLHRYDAIHCADRAIRTGGFLAWLFRVRLVFEWRTASGHDLARWLNRRSRRFQRAIGLIFSDAPCASSRLRDTGLYGRLASFSLLPDPGVVRQLPPAARLKGAAQPFRLAALSTDSAALNPLLDALPSLLALPNFRLRLACGAPAVAERLRSTLGKRMPGAVLAEVGPLPRSAAALNACLTDVDLVFLPPAHGEAAPALLLDVMAAGRAILAIRCPAYASLLSPGNASLLSADPAEIAEAVRRHMNEPLLCATHAVAAAETVRAECGFSPAADRVRSCYGLVLEEGAS